ncbi:MAG: hypothetical protein RL648_1133 [Verrucomicrobiota bacterium]
MDLKKHPFFREIDADSAESLRRSAMLQKLERGTVIFEEGELSDTLYLVLEGQVAFSKALPRRGFLQVSSCKEGDSFGEIGIITSDRRSLRAVAATDCVIACIPGAAVVSYLSKLPGPVQGILQSLIGHLNVTTHHFVDDRVRQEKMALVGNMTNTIIHDFKNPFCLISLSAQMLRQRHRDDASQQLCQNIEKQVDRMVTMVTELAEFSRGEHSIVKTRISLPEFFDEFRALNQPYFEQSKVSIDIKPPKGVVLGSKAKLIRVFQNLISNAIEAFGEKEGNIRVTGTLKPSDKVVEIQVEDNADGIPESIREHLFEPFVSFGKREGTGLGTAIARSIVEAHGGDIRFRTETGRGTVFIITLPLAR